MFRKVLYLTVIPVFFGSLYLYSASLQPVFLSLQATWVGFAIEKSLVIRGLRVLKEQDLELEKLSKKSNFWWLLNRSEVESVLVQHPLVSEARVEPCGVFKWGCFAVHLKERKPTLLAAFGDELWLVGEDNALILPVTREDRSGLMGRLSVERFIDGPIVEGLLPEGAAPELLAPRLKYARAAINLIERSSGLKVDRVNMEESGETKVRFRTLNADVIFGFANQDLQELEKQARRFKGVLDEFQGNTQALGSIDLAFNAQAVVKLVQ